MTIDTPRSPVNVFTPQTGALLAEELGRGLARGVRAVVLQSAKPASFINGVGLLLAASSRSAEALAEAGRIRGFYQVLASAPVPTVAAIRGNCYGCGLELALACDVRIAEHTPATRFRMPEIHDYGFVPLFGGTQRLPALVGVRRAVDLIVFGAHLRAPDALEIGLVDELAPRAGLGAAVDRILRNLHDKPPPRAAARAPSDDTMRRIRERIGQLSPLHQPLARDALRLARLPGESDRSRERGMRAELDTFHKTVATRGAAQSMAFFFVRQAAKLHGVGTQDYGAPEGVRGVARGATRSLRTLRHWLEGQPRRGETLTFVEAGRRGSCAAVAEPGHDPAEVSARADAAAYLPVPDAPLPPVELVADEPRRLFLLLEDAGFDPVVTRARGSFVSDRLLAAVRRSSREALFRFGFLSFARGRGTDDPVLALAEVAVDALAAGEVKHPAQADLLAHTVAGFPVARGSLLRHVDAGLLPKLRRRVGAERLRRALRGRGGFYRS